MPYRILVVDDNALWRRTLGSMLLDSRRWHVLWEAAGGVEAIHSAHTLGPDVILLDVELGGLDGIETARRILAGDCRSKILFVSAHRSWDIVGTALSTGAHGYLMKSEAGHELVPAMETVVRGGRFISASLLGRALDPPRRTVAGHRRPRSHEAAFYAGDALLVDSLAQFAVAALTAGKSSIVAVTKPRRARLDETMRAHGIDVDRAIHDGRYFPLDVADMLSQIMIDGWPDETRFWRAAMSLAGRAASVSPDDHPRLAVCGEGAAFLVEQGRVDAAIRLESLWDEAARACNIEIFCPYMLPPGSGPEQTALVQRIGAVHSAVHGA